MSPGHMFCSQVLLSLACLRAMWKAVRVRVLAQEVAFHPHPSQYHRKEEFGVEFRVSGFGLADLGVERFMIEGFGV